MHFLSLSPTFNEPRHYPRTFLCLLKAGHKISDLLAFGSKLFCKISSVLLSGIGATDGTIRLESLRTYRYINWLHDCKRVLEDGPRSFKRNLVVLKAIGKDEQPTERNMHVKDSRVSIWIWLLNIPLSKRNKASGHRIAAKLYDVMNIDNAYF
ncbi:reverse transcriptase [Tanacetum coccineum]